AAVPDQPRGLLGLSLDSRRGARGLLQRDRLPVPVPWRRAAVVYLLPVLMSRPLQLARVSLSVLLAAAALEVCARIDDRYTYGAPMTGYFDIDTIYEFDELGRRGKPNAQYQKWKLNSLGFRGPDLAPDKLTVAVLGASEA